MPTGTLNINPLQSRGILSENSGCTSPLSSDLGEFESSKDSQWNSVEKKGYLHKESSNVKDEVSVGSTSGNFENDMNSKKFFSKGPIVLWPIQPKKLHKRGSCELTQQMSPCIEKATFHLYQLQDKLAAGTGVSSSTIGAKPIPFPIRNTTKRIQLKPLKKAGSSLPPLVSDVSEEKEETQVVGAGYVIPKKIDSALTDFAQDVIDEHLLLLGRLETDRYNTEQALIFERERVKKLRKKIDDLAYKRMCDLPVAVQREHEACAYDIQEFKWHITQRERIQEKSRNKLLKTEQYNKELTARIRHMEQHCPSVQVKLSLDQDEMKNIDEKQGKTDVELAEVIKRLQKMENKYTDATTKADTEKDGLNADLEIVREVLRQVTEELKECQACHYNQVQTLKEGNNKLKEYGEELDRLETKRRNVTEVEKQKQKKVTELKTMIADQEREHKTLSEENRAMAKEKEQTKVQLENQNARLELDIKRAVKELKDLVATNRTTEREIREVKKSIVKWGKQESENGKAVKRAAQEMDKLSKELKIMEEETTKLRLKNEKLTSYYSHLKENTEYQEETLRQTCDNLKKQLKEEIHARTVLQAKIAAESSDFVRIQDDTSKKRAKVGKRADEIENLVQTIREQVDKLQKAHNDRVKVINELDKIIDKVKTQHKETEDKLSVELHDLTSKENTIKDECNTLHKTLSDMAWRTEAMKKKMQDMESSSVMMNKVQRTTNDAIDELSDELEEVKIQLEASRQIESNLRDSINQVKGRGSETGQAHQEHIKRRNTFLSEREQELSQIVHENENLALIYHSAQENLMAIKHEFLRIYEKGLISDNNLKDQEGLCDLHRRLHHALECYYQLRGLKTRAGLARFEEMNAANGERLGQIQGQMHQAIDQISRFLLANKASQEEIRLQAEHYDRETTIAS